jgi:hypothetical protein
MNRGLIAFGIITLITGAWIGHLMYTHPEGLNPEWPLGMALIVPAVFVLGGLHLVAMGMGRPRLANAMLGAVVVFLWAIVNWAAFFTDHFECLATVSFLGVQVAEWYPSEKECRDSLRMIVAGIDALVVVAVGVFAWQRHRALRAEPER